MPISKGADTPLLAIMWDIAQIPHNCYLASRYALHASEVKMLDGMAIACASTHRTSHLRGIGNTPECWYVHMYSIDTHKPTKGAVRHYTCM